MDSLSELVKSIDIKCRQIALKHNKLKQEYSKLEHKYEETEKNNYQLKQTITELEKQIQILTIAKSIPTAGDKSLGKKKINELLRELDTCIDLLNNNTI